MSSKKTYQVPSRMHYDIWEISPSGNLFMCSTNKENSAREIMEGLVSRIETMGCSFGTVTYKIRTRPTVEHTIHSMRV